jgi:hypothetical protein
MRSGRGSVSGGGGWEVVCQRDQECGWEVVCQRDQECRGRDRRAAQPAHWRGLGHEQLLRARLGRRLALWRRRQVRGRRGVRQRRRLRRRGGGHLGLGGSGGLGRGGLGRLDVLGRRLGGRGRGGRGRELVGLRREQRLELGLGLLDCGGELRGEREGARGRAGERGRAGRWGRAGARAPPAPAPRRARAPSRRSLRPGSSCGAARAGGAA